MNLSQIIHRRSRLIRFGIYQARELVVLKWVSLSELIKKLDFDRFHIIYVVDEDLKIIRRLTEQEIIDAITKYDCGITIEEYLKYQ